MKFLPPGLQSLSTHTFGSLYLQITDIKTTAQSPPTHFIPYFFGQSPNENINNSNIIKNNKQNCSKSQLMHEIDECLQYKIMTNLWHFYLYLSDTESIDIQLFVNRQRQINGSQRESQLYAKIKLPLNKLQQVMKIQYSNQNIFQVQQSRCTVLDNRGNPRGSINVKIWTKFDMEICQQIKQLIDFSSFVIFQGISPIHSETQLPRQPPQQLSLVKSSSQQKRIQNKNFNKNKQEKEKEKYSHIFYPQQSSIQLQEHISQIEGENNQNDDNEDQRLLQHDIDRLIHQMQSKPYDSSRYQQSLNNQHNNFGKGIKSQYADFYKSDANSESQSINNTYNLGNNTQPKLVNYIRNQSQNSHKFLQTEASLKHPLSRPPTYSPKPKQKIITQTPQQTIRSKSPHLIKNAQFSQNKMQPFVKSDSSYIQLKIHQMLVSLSNALPHTLFQQLMQPCYTIKIYLNNDQQEYFAGQGIKQGEIVSFNQNLKIRNVAHVQAIRFSICDDYGKIQCQGVFDLTRLYASKDLKGVFTVPLLAYSGNMVQSKLTINANKLLEVSPLHRTLRLQAELIQKIQLVQIFMRISNVNLPFTLLRYKVPLTKETIQHFGLNHVNIFPHTCNAHTSDKIIIQFCKNQQNIGQTEISLKNIKNMNATALNNNIQPVYLYDGKKQIRNILQNDRLMGQCNITVCFGNVKQMQALLLQTIDQQKTIAKQIKSRVPVALDQRLGVFVNKKAVQSNQISIQVQLDMENQFRQQKVPQKILSQKICNQPSFGDQSMISHTSHNQFMDASLVSFAKHQENNEQILQPTFTKKSQKSENLLNYPTLTSQISKNLCKLLTPILPDLKKLKQLCKPHLTYNFISLDKLKQIMASLGIKIKLINNIFNLVLLPKGQMVNFNILYDLLISVQIQDCIKQNLMEDQLIVIWGLRLLYGRQEKQKKRRGQDEILLQNQMEFREMVDIFRTIKLKLNLHEYKIMQKFLRKYPTRKSALQLKKAVIMQLQTQAVQQIKQGFYQQDILKQIYGDDSSMNSSNFQLNVSQQSNYHRTNKGQQKQIKQNIQMNEQNKIQTHTKLSSQQYKQIIAPKSPINASTSKNNKITYQSVKYYQRIQIDGISNVIQSAEFAFDTLKLPITFKISLQHPIKKQIIFDQNNKTQQLETQMQMKDIDGRVDLMSNGNTMASAAFSLIKDVQSLYPLKGEKGEFCGLLNLTLF